MVIHALLHGVLLGSSMQLKSNMLGEGRSTVVRLKEWH